QETLRDLDEPAAVEAVGEGARVDGEYEERHPVADDGEAAEGRRVERLEDDPVAGDVLDALGRHADERQQEVVAVVPVVEVSDLGGRGSLRGGRPAHAGDPTSFRRRRNRAPPDRTRHEIFSVAAVAPSRAWRRRPGPRTSPTSPRDAGAGRARPARSRNRPPR